MSTIQLNLIKELKQRANQVRKTLNIDEQSWTRATRNFVNVAALLAKPNNGSISENFFSTSNLNGSVPPNLLTKIRSQLQSFAALAIGLAHAALGYSKKLASIKTPNDELSTTLSAEQKTEKNTANGSEPPQVATQEDNNFVMPPFEKVTEIDWSKVQDLASKLSAGLNLSFDPTLSPDARTEIEEFSIDDYPLSELLIEADTSSLGQKQQNAIDALNGFVPLFKQYRAFVAQLRKLRNCFAHNLTKNPKKFFERQAKQEEIEERNKEANGTLDFIKTLNSPDRSYANALLSLGQMPQSPNLTAAKRELKKVLKSIAGKVKTKSTSLVTQLNNHLSGSVVSKDLLLKAIKSLEDLQTRFFNALIDLNKSIRAFSNLEPLPKLKLKTVNSN